MSSINAEWLRGQMDFVEEIGQSIRQYEEQFGPIDRDVIVKLSQIWQIGPVAPTA